MANDEPVEPAGVHAVDAPSSSEGGASVGAPRGFFARRRAAKAAKGAEGAEKVEEKAEEEKGDPPIPFLQLWRYTTPFEKFLVFLGSVAAAVHGALLPVWTIFFGEVITAFGDADPSAVVDKIAGFAKWFFVIAAIAFVMSFIQVRFQMVVATRTSIRMRKLYFRSLMRQDFSWYDAENSGELTARVASDVDLIQAGMGDKVGSAVQFLTMAVVGFIISFVYTWKLTLVILSTTPVLAICGGIFAKMTADATTEGQGAYGAAGGIASEVISLIRTVHAFGGQEEEAKRYEGELGSAYKNAVTRGFFNGLGMGLTMFLIFCTYALSFWFGARLIRNEEISVTDLFVAFFSVLMGSMGLGQAAPSFQAFATARGAAPRVYEIIDRASSIDALDDDGDRPVDVNGDLAFKDMSFNYASRADEGSPPVLRNLNLHIRAGTTHALVGPSGCGKSSTMGLIERFYDPQEGSVCLDGADVKTLNVRWLRAQMGYVGQMPTLFRGSIRENIAFGAGVDFCGKDGSYERRDVSDEEIVAAAKLANAHSFISKLPEGYATKLGERGALLSGGQKQRICIARAVVRNPKVLLLDEATSALDAQSERIVQNALEKAAAGRTTVVIAHRLSTVRNADVISVFKNGEIAESGSHDELVKLDGGVYQELVELQRITAEKGASSGDDAVVDPDALPVEDSGGPSQSKTGVDSTGAMGGAGEDEDEEEKPDVDAGIISKTFKYNSSEALFILLGCAGAALAGASWPLSALVFSKVTVLLAQPNNSGDITFWTLMFVAVGAGSLIGNVLQMGMLGISGERLTRKLRSQSFRALLRQEMGFFDREENSVGALTTRLATEASYVQGLTGGTLGMIVITLSTIITGLGVSFSGCWRLALIVLAMLPLMSIGGYVQMKMMTGFDAGSKKEFVGAGSVASEAVDNIRTVTSLGVQDEFIGRYDDNLVQPARNGVKAANTAGISFGFSEFFMFALWAIAFLAGSKFIEKDQCDFEGLMKAVTGLMFAGITLGNVSVFAPDVASAKVAATKIFRMLDRESEIDPSSPAGGVLSNVRGDMAAKQVFFEYPTRPDVAVLRGLDVSVSQGKTLALCGQSGCGKSTMVALLERFYDIRSGSLTLDGEEIQGLNLQNARSHMSLVQQEPDLFDRTVRANISYGLSKEDGTPVSDDVIEAAAKAANAHGFITNDLPLGYDTPVGERGGAMSGGMKQRIAIARALVRNPRLLLLDEATSALDARSERVVQEALDAARLGRTTVVIAHRLSTIKDADIIALVSRGKIAESGTHDELMAKNGEYAELVKYQMTEEPSP